MERIGILLVHGIGEQKRFDHLRGDLAPILAALKAEAARLGGTLRVEISRGDSDMPGAEASNWSVGDVPPVRAWIEIGGTPTHAFDFRELWWADLDEPFSIPNVLRFWLDTLLIWSAAGKGRLDFFKLQPPPRYALPRFADGVAAKKDPARAEASLRVGDRRLLRRISVLAVALALPARLVEYLLARYFRVDLRALTILFNYLNDVLMIGRDDRRGGGSLEDADEPIRAAIKRRTLRAFAQMGLADYDRWYILAHSLGTVVSQIGLNADEADFDALLDRRRRAQFATGGIRQAVFAKLEGFLTYGSPLDKFAAIWPLVVPLNPDEQPFVRGDRAVEWINAWSHNDPISGSLDAFDYRVDYAKATQATSFKPTNIEVPASPRFLFAHIRYLADRRGAVQPLAEGIARWISSGGRFGYAGTGYSEQESDRLQPLKWIVFGIYAFAISWLIVGLAIFPWLCDSPQCEIWSCKRAVWEVNGQVFLKSLAYGFGALAAVVAILATLSRVWGEFRRPR